MHCHSLEDIWNVAKSCGTPGLPIAALVPAMPAVCVTRTAHIDPARQLCERVGVRVSVAAHNMTQCMKSDCGSDAADHDDIVAVCSVARCQRS